MPPFWYDPDVWWQLKQKLVLWLVGSQFAAGLSDPQRASLGELETVGPGVQRGQVDGFPTYVVDLALPAEEV